VRRVLMIAYHFPPLTGSSGIQRTLRFVQHLPALGWEPLVLTADPRAYERTSPDLLADVPTSTIVRRAFALDTARHLQLRGRYIGAMARPDRWISWRWDGVRQGLRMIRQFKPELIWSTYPIATAHLIGKALHLKTGLPWIADFRDPMAQEGYPADTRTWESYRSIEADAARLASYCVFTSPGAAAEYRQRYPDAAPRMVVVENGYDEESFAGVALSVGAPIRDRAVTLLHSGIVYPSERDPSHLFDALAGLQQSGRLTPADLRIRFRASAHDDLLRSSAAERGVLDFVELAPAIPYRQALAEMLEVDGLLVLQASNCNAQIPAKIYEYLRAGRPILGLTDPIGDTAGVLRHAGIETQAPLDAPQAIADSLVDFVQRLRSGRLNLPRTEAVTQASRRGRTQQLIPLLDSAVR